MITFNSNNITGGNFFNGSTFSDRSVFGLETGKPKSFDEWKSADSRYVEMIEINSRSIPINISVSNSSKLEAHFYGKANLDEDIKFEFNVINSELKITLNLTGNCYNSNLKLDVIVPRKTFKSICVKISLANIILNEGVSTEYLKAQTNMGALETNATFTNALFETSNGDVNLCIDAKSDIIVQISTKIGNIKAKFNNIGYMVSSTNTMHGNVKKCHAGGTGYTANVDISTTTGNITIIS